ncbi:MAG: DUF2259 domain-containing protein [Spirochaetaceae bacterium]|nr:MAG: DUF2259 domain-containing protein [Spirochaetaceae bacterium]
MTRKAVLLATLLSFSAPILIAGDISRFMNLGFSDDSKYFMFGQYGIDASADTPYAQYFIIDVAKNSYVQGGTQSQTYTSKALPGNDGSGGLFMLLEKTYSTIQKYKINHLTTGRIVYVLIDGEKPQSELEFRDFTAGNLYSVKLSQNSTGSGTTVASSFSINVTVSGAGGTKTTYTIGRPDYTRKGIKEYRIKYVIIAPDGKSLVFVLERTEVGAKGESVRYMVETQTIR